MASDLRYMKLGRGPGSTWFFVYNIPKDLRGHPRFMTSRGKPMTKITESLETTDPEKAQDRRDTRVVYWNRQFRMLRDGPSEDDIREVAVDAYRAALKERAAEGPFVMHRPKDIRALLRRYAWEMEDDIREQEYKRELDEALSHLAAREIKESGALLEPKTDAYRNLGIEIVRAKIAAGLPNAYLPLPDGRELRGLDQDLPRIEPPIPSEPKPITDPPPPKKTAETFSEAFERYLATELDGTSEQSIADYRRKVKVFTDKIDDLPLGKITDHNRRVP
jgi:hypothetical protein